MLLVDRSATTISQEVIMRMMLQKHGQTLIGYEQYVHYIFVLERGEEKHTFTDAVPVTC